MNGYKSGVGEFAGTLDYDAVSGIFSGTITTQNEYTGTADELLSSASPLNACLLPDGYESYESLSISWSGYGASIKFDFKESFAESKAAAVEQLSWEQASTYSSGFALAPRNAILNLTITGLAASTEVEVNFALSAITAITKNVTTDGSGAATFAVGILENYDLNTSTLTVGGNVITLVSESKTLTAGKINNITRSAAPATPSLTLTSPTVGQVIGDDGKNYAAGASLPGEVTAVAMIAYVSGYSGLNGALATAGGNSSKLQENGVYWSSTERDDVDAYGVALLSGTKWDFDYKTSDFRVRACLAF